MELNACLLYIALYRFNVELLFQGRHGHPGRGGIGAALGEFAGAMFNEFANAHQPHHSPVCEVLKKATRATNIPQKSPSLYHFKSYLSWG